MNPCWSDSSRFLCHLKWRIISSFLTKTRGWQSRQWKCSLIKKMLINSKLHSPNGHQLPIFIINVVHFKLQKVRNCQKRQQKEETDEISRCTGSSRCQSNRTGGKNCGIQNNSANQYVDNTSILCHAHILFLYILDSWILANIQTFLYLILKRMPLSDILDLKSSCPPDVFVDQQKHNNTKERREF